MPILRRLIIIEWFKSFFVSVTALFILVSLSNLIAGFLRSSVTETEVLINTLFEAPLWIKRLLPISSLIATLFSLNKLQRRSELTAILASGFSIREVLLSILISSSVVTTFAFFNNFFIIPILKNYKTEFLPDSSDKFRNDKSLGLKISTLDSGRIWFKSGRYFFSYEAFDKNKAEIRKPNIFFYNNDFKLETYISGKKAKWVSEKKWIVDEGREVFFLDINNFPKIENTKDRTLFLNQSKEDFIQFESDISTLLVFSLIRFVWKIKQTGINTSEYETFIFDKINSAFYCLLFSLVPLGALFSPNKRSASFGKNVTIVFLFSLFYWLLNSYLLTAGNAGHIEPFLASSIIPVGLISFLFYRLHRREALFS